MKILAIDYGSTRTGLAICDENEILASPLCVLKRQDDKNLIDKIETVIKENQIKKVIMGLPARTDGKASETARKVEEFAGMMTSEINVTPELVDERFTTVIASQRLHQNNVKAKKQKNIIDAAAAAILLQDYIDKNKNQM